MPETAVIDPPPAPAVAVTATPTTGTPPPAASSQAVRRAVEQGRVPRSSRDAWTYALIVAMVVLAWGITRLHLYDTKSDLAYWMGVAGGVGMLALLTYPMRKHWRFMQRFGGGRGWFVAHMILGVCGPLLILLHSNFELGSLNATVAFFAMATVAISGVVGRFLYLQVHRNLRGEKIGLDQLRAMLGTESAAASRLRFAPAVVERCRAFEAWAVGRPMITAAELLRAMVAVPLMRWRTQRACRAELRRRLVAVAHTEGWSRRKLDARQRAARKLVGAYLGGAQRVAMFAAWERLFSWWHVAHVPFVYILVISAVAHVVAVHAY